MKSFSRPWKESTLATCTQEKKSMSTSNIEQNSHISASECPYTTNRNQRIETSLQRPQQYEEMFRVGSPMKFIIRRTRIDFRNVAAQKKVRALELGKVSAHLDVLVELLLQRPHPRHQAHHKGPLALVRGDHSDLRQGKIRTGVQRQARWRIARRFEKSTYMAKCGTRLAVHCAPWDST
jgi:hypothetical protein